MAVSVHLVARTRTARPDSTVVSGPYTRFGVLAFIDFLNSREKASILWGLALLVYVVPKTDGLGRNVFGILRTLFGWKLSLLWGLSALYTAALVLVAQKIGLWHTTAIKETVYWYFGTGAILAGRAVATRHFDREFVARTARTALRFTIIVEFLLSLYVLPFVLELFFIPILFAFLTMQVMADSVPNSTQVKNISDWVLTVIGFILMLYVVVSALIDVNGLLTRDHGEHLLLAPAFTLAFVPFLFLVWQWSRWDSRRIMSRWRDERDARRSAPDALPDSDY